MLLYGTDMLLRPFHISRQAEAVTVFTYQFMVLCSPLLAQLLLCSGSQACCFMYACFVYTTWMVAVNYYHVSGSATYFHSAGNGASISVMVCVANSRFHSYFNLVSGCADFGAQTQKQLQLGVYCAPIFGWPHLLCDCGLHHPDR